MRNRTLYILQNTLIFVDFVILNACYLLAFLFVDTFRKQLTGEPYLHFWAVYNIIWFLCIVYFKVYDKENSMRIENNFRATWRSLALHAFLMTVYFVFTKNTSYSRQFLIFLYIFLAATFTVSRFGMTLIDIYFRRRMRTKTSVAVLGFNPTGIKLANYFEKQSPHFNFKGILDEKETMFVSEAGELQTKLRRGIQLAHVNDVKEVYAAIPPEMMPSARILLQEAEQSFVRLKLVPDLSSAMAARYQITYMDDFPVITLRHEPLEMLNNRLKKRIFDMIFSTLVIVLLISWLYPIIALIIKYQSPGPVLFKQMRSGRDNKPFMCYKFRSMKMNTDSDTKQATKDDDRITKIGKIMRKTSLDELPQFFNVFKGEMSVVGPRPHMLKHTEQYRAIIDQFMVRHFLKPGITGWAQVTGYRGETKDPRQMEKRVEKDIYYMENWSLMFDVRIIFLTVYMAVKGDEAAF